MSRLKSSSFFPTSVLMERMISGEIASASALCTAAISCLISELSLKYFSISSCCLAGVIVAKVRGLGTVAGLVVGVTDSELGGRSLGDASGAGFVADSWRGRFGSGVGVLGSLCRLRPRAGLAISNGDSQYTRLL